MSKSLVKRDTGTVGWVITMTCSHAAFLVSQLNQLVDLDDQARKLVKKSVDRALRFAAVGMWINRMNLTTLYIVAYSDSLLARNFDLSLQISGLIFLRKLRGNATLTQYWSRKCQRVTPSSLAREIITFITVFNSAFMLRNAVLGILCRRKALFAFTDS